MIEKIGILGYGYVGKATHRSLLSQSAVNIHDTLFGTSRTILKDDDIVFVCLPTSSYQDIEILKQEIKYLLDQNPFTQIIIRSTLPIGSCCNIETEFGIKLIYIPEFLRERFWEIDCLKRPLVVGHNGATLPQWLVDQEIIECSTAEAEIVKMYSNNFAVVRIAFANLFYDLSQTQKADHGKIVDIFKKVEHDQSYMQVPGHDGTRGFGGKCLPKDLDFLIDTLKENTIDNNWLVNIRTLNKQWQEKF